MQIIQTYIYIYNIYTNIQNPKKSLNKQTNLDSMKILLEKSSFKFQNSLKTSKDYSDSVQKIIQIQFDKQDLS